MALRTVCLLVLKGLSGPTDCVSVGLIGSLWPLQTVCLLVLFGLSGLADCVSAGFKGLSGPADRVSAGFGVS